MSALPEFVFHLGLGHFPGVVFNLCFLVCSRIYCVLRLAKHFLLFCAICVDSLLFRGHFYKLLPCLHERERTPSHIQSPNRQKLFIGLVLGGLGGLCSVVHVRPRFRRVEQLPETLKNVEDVQSCATAPGLQHSPRRLPQGDLETRRRVQVLHNQQGNLHSAGAGEHVGAALRDLHGLRHPRQTESQPQLGRSP